VVNVGVSHDTAEFAVESIRRWWKLDGRPTYAAARRLLICADAGGSNGNRLRAWKVHLQELADQIQIEITVCHYPPGTRKWNQIEHRSTTAEKIQFAASDRHAFGPGVESALDPTRDRYRAHVASFADQVDDRPTTIAALEVARLSPTASGCRAGFRSVDRPGFGLGVWVEVLACRWRRVTAESPGRGAPPELSWRADLPEAVRIGGSAW
jgi:hypothetical protein